MKFIETTNEGVHCYNRFSADFSDDIVKLNNRNYPLGAVSKMVANISKEEMDVLLQLGGKALNCYKTISLLGYNRNVFLIHKGVILDMLSYMKNFEIFQCFDYEGSKKLVDDLLSEEALDKYEDYLDDDKPLTEERALKLKDIKNGNRLGYVLKCLAYNIKVSIKYIIEGFLGPEKLKNYFDIPFRKIKRKYLPFVDDNTIVIYSEDMYGNPLHAKNVVRWLLWYNKVYRQDGTETYGYEKKDLFFAYREIFNDSKLNPECRILCTPFMDLEKYSRYNFGERNGKCYVLRKGKWRVRPEDVADGIVVDDLSEREKVRVFNECEYCISYDTQTAYSALASICGCISVVVPEEGKTREDYRPNGEIDYGVAFGFSEEEIQFAISTRGKLIEYYKFRNQEGLQQARYFVDECEKYF